MYPFTSPEGLYPSNVCLALAGKNWANRISPTHLAKRLEIGARFREPMFEGRGVGVGSGGQHPIPAYFCRLNYADSNSWGGGAG